MDSSRWQRIENLFNATLALPANERQAHLDETCSGDPHLRAELDSLLEESEQPDTFLSESAFTLGLKAFSCSDSDRLIGSRLGPYLILSVLGRGGMGDVYLAHDPRLQRKVAIKLLPLSLTQDEERVKRFQHEARAASTISHPNIAHIFEVGEAEGRRFTVMEYVDGLTLRQRLANGPLTMTEAVNVAMQVASALQAAHASRVIHRDIKPENIIIRRDSLVKILDFGLAKLLLPEGRTPDIQDPTLDHVETNPGTVMGTAQYMSPEQARGLAVDERTDIWSLGCVLYEMITGSAPFKGSTTSDIIAEILKSDPVLFINSLTNLPPALKSILRNMLNKPRDERYHSANDAWRALQRVQQQLTNGAARSNDRAHQTNQRTEALPGRPTTPGFGAYVSSTFSNDWNSCQATGYHDCSSFLAGPNHRDPCVFHAPIDDCHNYFTRRNYFVGGPPL